MDFLKAVKQIRSSLSFFTLICVILHLHYLPRSKCSVVWMSEINVFLFAYSERKHLQQEPRPCGSFSPKLGLGSDARVRLASNTSWAFCHKSAMWVIELTSTIVSQKKKKKSADFQLDYVIETFAIFFGKLYKIIYLFRILVAGLIPMGVREDFLSHIK